MNNRIVLFSALMAFSMLLASVAFAATVTIRPDAQGLRTGWTNVGCSSGSAEWQCVDETVANTSDYLYATGTGKESFSFSNSGLANESINSLTMVYWAMQHNSASNSCFSAMVRSAGVDYTAATQLCVGASWQYVNYTYTTHPATSSAWTVTEVDALEAGMQGTNPNGGGRVAQMYVIVDYNLSQVCGNNAQEGTEVCDGSDLNGQTCASQGFSGGTLGCLSGCSGFNTTGCYTNSCSDSDGFNLSIAGNVTGNSAGNPFAYLDFCTGNSTVVEFYCSGTNPSNASQSCTTNTTSICFLGACI